jgi:Rod binding domain-containing protein
MSEMGPLNSLSLPAVVPAEVRNGDKQTKEAYAAAVGFERMLVKQLTKSLTDSSALGGGENPSTPGAYREMMSDGIADAITSAGGIGLAENLYKQALPEESA